MGSKASTRGDWPRVRFGDVVENVNDQPIRSTLPPDTRYIAGEHVDESRLTIDRWGTLGDDLVPPTFKRRFQPGDVLFHSRNLKKIAVPGFGGITGEKLFVLRSTSPDLLQEFVPHVLLAPGFTAYAEASWSGSVNKFLNWTPLANYEFDLPPIEKQRKYVTVAAATDRHVDATKALREASVRLRESYLSTCFGWTGPEAVRFGAFSVPPSWQLLTLPQMVTKNPNALTAGPFGTIFKAKDFRPSGVPIIQLRHITPEGIDCEGNMTFMDTAVYERLHIPYTVVPGDLLLTKLGEPPGLACIYPHGLPLAMVTPDVIKATLNSDILHASYAPWVFNNPRARANIARLCKGGTRTRVSLGELYKLKWPVPPLSVQFQMIEILESLALAVRSPARDRAMVNMKSVLSRTLAPTG